MTIPAIFIVGAPRCGTTSIYGYLAPHPKVFMSDPKEPHHFCSDLALRWRPFGDREDYLRLFANARSDQSAGEASVGYLYSTVAPHEIKKLSPSAKIIIMLRSPAEQIGSLHAHNLRLLHEDLTDLEEALAAEPERRLGQRIPAACLAPFALQYTALARYTEHIERYIEVFGPESVKCILFDDLKTRPEEVYRETLAFLGLEAGEMPNFKAHNPLRRWRHQRLARLMIAPFNTGFRVAFSLRPGLVRLLAITMVRIPRDLVERVLLDKASPPPAASPALRNRLRREFADEVQKLGTLLGRDLSSWSRPEPELRTV